MAKQPVKKRQVSTPRLLAAVRATMEENSISPSDPCSSLVESLKDRIVAEATAGYQPTEKAK